MSDLQLVPSGVPGLDELLDGGLVPGRLYLVRGSPGTGKTLLGMEFLSAGLNDGETVLFIHGEESQADITANAAELGIDLSDAAFLDLGPESDFFTGDQSYDLVNPQDVEATQFIDDIRDAIEDLDPDRVCIDPITQLRYVESSDYQFRKRIIALARFLKDRGSTVIATRTEYENNATDDDIASLSDGIIELQRGDAGRRIRVPKHRGIGQKDGTHGLEIRDDGIEVYPSIIPENHQREFEVELVSSGVDELDALLGGGIERGTSTFVSGPTGVGKTTTCTQFLREAAENGDNPIAYLFEESPETFTYRSEAFDIPVSDLRESGDLYLEPIEPLDLSPEEFARDVQRHVEERDSNVVLIDGVEGYKMSLQGNEGALGAKLHALVRYLTNLGVTVLLVDEIKEVTGVPRPTSANVSYVADNIMFLSYVEMGGELRRVMGVLKKRVGDFEHTLREFSISERGIELGEPLHGLQGVLNGSPTWVDRDEYASSR
ncbi:ATPase domain-containing protein [Salarchaeum japonicum]|uniref:non-specific serine/threonine protein kinase n=1 Tax=Salarchaeum japonicum TaxID=555573 RepID=A0AAV3SYX3_9EURY|nr:ATPase domain-containing protein [Salarchaeum japonicum]